MKYIVAVSGGVDSVVLLDMMSKRKDNQLIVAHFDHGIRPDSAADERFVRALAGSYRLPYQSQRKELGEHASEEIARSARYDFLHTLAGEHNAQLVTAHHQDDLIETIAHNCMRGTGWRGLAVFGDERISRPFVTKTKKELYDYALAHNLEWVEDETNRDERYTRNRIRQTIHRLSVDDRTKLAKLWTDQHELKARIESEVDKFTQDKQYSRYFMIMTPQPVAVELLRSITHMRLHRPQLDRLLLAIKTQLPGTLYEAGNGVSIRFSKQDFIVETTV